VDPRLGALGELGEGQLAQVEVLLRAEGSAQQQLLPATTRGASELRRTTGDAERRARGQRPRTAGIHERQHLCGRGDRARPYLTFHAVVKSGFSSNRVQVISAKAEGHTAGLIL